MLDLRLLGFSRSLPVRRLAAHVLPWTIASFLLVVPSGLAMFLARASELVASPLFTLKVCLILAAVSNAAVFYVAIYRGAAQWDVDVMPPFAARASAALSLLLWISVIACGLLLAST